MADKVRRQKDLITRTVDKYKSTTLKDYAKYFEGSPTYVTYYQLDSVATQQDSNLENVNNLIGANSPNKYKKIEDMVIYGVDALQISNEISEKGLQSLISGDFVILPDSIRPYPGDFFVFDDSELQEHLFRINDVQFDKASPRKFFRCAFALYQDNTDLILGNVEGDYVLNYESIAGETSAVIRKEDAAIAENVKKLVDGLVSKYTTLFYDEDMDTFSCVVTGTQATDLLSLWSPYLQKFIHDHKVLEKYTDNFMTEIYVNDINQSTNREIFSDLAYFNSMFRKVELGEPLTFENSFMARSTIYDLKSTRNLPFFHGTHTYNDLQVRRDSSSFYPGSFHLVFQDYGQTFASISDEFKFEEGAEIDTGGFSDGQIFYELGADDYPISVYRMFGSTPTDIGFSSTEDIAGETLYNVVKNHLLDSAYVTGASISGTVSATSSGTVSSITGPVSGVYTYSLTVSSAQPLEVGMLLEKASGVGVLGTGAYIHAISGSVLTVKATTLPVVGAVVFKTLPVSGVYTYTVSVTGSPSVTTDLLMEKVSGTGILGTNAYISAVNGSVLTVKSESQPTAGAIVFRFIERLIVNDSLLTEINSLFLTTNIKNYIFLPLVIHVLKMNVEDSAS
jgi:hypothetical protein